jgi:hypothetical protein
MSNKGSFKFILFFVALQFFTLSIDAHAVKKSNFAFAVSYGQESSQRLCLVGKFKAKIKVTLLSSLSGSKKVCAATTSQWEELDTGNGYLTELTGSCETPDGYDIGILRQPVKDYEKLSLKEVTNTETVSKVSRIVMSSKALLALREKKEMGSIELGGATLRVYQVPVPGLHILIASFEYSKDNGPRIIVINDRIYPLTGWCSFPTLNVFRLEGQHYISSGSSCCECGIIVHELFRITPKGPVTVLADASFSN